MVLNIILETAVQNDKVMQDFDSESILMGGDHSQKAKAPPIKIDYGSKDCVNLSFSTVVSRIIPYLLYGLILSVSTLYAKNAHLEKHEPIPHIVSKYRILDIGPTEIDSSRLTKTAPKTTLSPQINNIGQGIGNRSAGGFLFLPSRWEYSPQVSGMTINIHAINQNGDLLVALSRGSESLEWMVWPWKEEGYGGVRKHVHTVDPFKSEFYPTGFNDAGMIIGYQKNDGKYVPIVWTSKEGLRSLGENKGLQIQGIAKAINKKGTVVGVSEEVSDRIPFYWNEQSGLDVLRKYRNHLDPKGWIEFADMVLTDDDTLYGTYWVKHLTEGDTPRMHNPTFGYMWKPSEGKIQMLPLNGMRIAAVNNAHTLVGTINGKAAIREAGRTPIELSSLMDPNIIKEWELIEATSINDKGQIVGFGKFKDKTHIFLADPLH